MHKRNLVGRRPQQITLPLAHRHGVGSKKLPKLHLGKPKCMTKTSDLSGNHKLNHNPKTKPKVSLWVIAEILLHLT